MSRNAPVSAEPRSVDTLRPAVAQGDLDSSSDQEVCANANQQRNPLRQMKFEAKCRSEGVQPCAEKRANAIWMYLLF